MQVHSAVSSVATIGWIVFGIGFLLSALATPEESPYGSEDPGAASGTAER